MKSKLLLVVFTTLCFAANATTYYISASGNDANNGTSTSTPWKSLNKLDAYFSLLKPGDNVLLNRGDIFYGSITVNASGKAGSPITISAYGTGSNPVITGFTNVTSWNNLGSNIWESTSAVSTLSTCNMVVINGVNTAMGRTPNTGFYTYQSFSGSISITSSSLNSAVTNWTGATAVIRKERYVFTKPTITSASGGTLNFTSDGYNGRNSWGFFIQNDARTLDIQNEWFYNTSTKKIRVYSTSSPTNVQMASVDALVTATNVSYITFDGIDFTGGNTEAFYVGNFANCKIINCNFDFNYNVFQGKPFGGSSANLLIGNNTFNHTNNNCIEYGTEFTNSTVTNNTIKNTSVFEGMMGSGQSGWGISITSSNALIQYNEVDTSGYIAIGFNCTDNSPNTVKNNFVNYFCFVKDDGGGIYSGNPQANQIIDSNIVINGIGNNAGTNGSSLLASGIYCDDNSSGFTIRNNSVGNISFAGLYLHNANNCTATSNTFYNCGLGMFISNDNPATFTTNIYSHQNTIIAKTTGANFSSQDQRTICFATIHTSGNDIRNFGDIDSNYYARPIDDNLSIRYTIYGVADNDANLAQWQTYSGFDVHSHKSPKIITDLNDLLFLYNSTIKSSTKSLNASYIDIKNVLYPGLTTLQPYSSAILIKNGAIINLPPTSNAGQDQSITLPTNSLTLSGSGTDADGTIASYQWTKVAGPSTYNISNSTSPGTSVTGLVQGVYQFQLKVTDNNGATANDTIQVTVNAASNQPPVANAGSDQTITLPLSAVTLIGSGSDPDGTIVSYQWKKISGPSAFKLVDPTSAVTGINSLVQGIYQFELTVTDNDGAIAIDAVQVTVNPAPNRPPVANAGSDKIMTLPTNSVTISGSGSDPDGTIVSYLWTKISGPSNYNIPDATGATININSLTEGTYQFQLKVTDNNGASATDILQVTVNAAPNVPPVANAGADQIITLPANSLNILGSGSDADGTVVGYLWTKVSGPANYNVVNPASPVTAINGLVQGVYQFQLKVTDNKGETSTDIMQLTVNPPANQAPVANAGADKAVTLPTNSLTVSGSGTDIDGIIAGYQWSKISGPTAYNIVNQTAAATEINGLVQGVYQFELRVTDNNGARGRDTMRITVNAAANMSPVAHAGSDVTIKLPVNTASLAGSGNDADGTVVSYFWAKISGPSIYNITNASSPVTDVWGLVKGVYKFELTVTDNNGATGRDTMQITVNDLANIAPIANAGQDQTITLPANIVSLTGSGTDADGTVAGYSWKQISGPLASVIVSANSANTLSNGLVGGTYKFELTVTDNLGAVGKDTVTIVVAEPRLNLDIQANTIKVYPNPVVDQTTLEINTSKVYPTLLLIVTDMKGGIVYKKEITGGQTNIKEKLNMSNLIKGTYALTVYYSDKEKQSIKVIRL